MQYEKTHTHSVWTWPVPSYQHVNICHVFLRKVSPLRDRSSINVVNKSMHRMHSCDEANPIRIRSPDPDDLQNLTGTSLSKDTSVITFSWKSHHFFQRYEPNHGKTRAKFSHRSIHPFNSFHVKLLTDRQTDKQTDRQMQVKH